MGGLSAAASALTADERLQQVIMNNIANLSTPGFKQSSGALTAFPQQLVLRYASGSNGQGAVPLGVVQNGVVFQEAVSNFTQGLIHSTGQPLDLAISDPVSVGTTVYAATPPAAGAAGQGAPSLVTTLSFVVGKNGVIETASGNPVVPVDAAGNPIPGARAVANPAFKGLDLFGADGAPVVDAAGQPSYRLIGAKGQTLPQTGAGSASLRMANAVTSGLRSFFAVANTAANGQTSIALTRDGQFHVGSNNLLYNAQGQRLLALSPGGTPILASGIRINPNYQGKGYFGSGGAPLRDAAGQLSYEAVNLNGAALKGATFGATAVNTGTLQPLGATDFLPTAATAYGQNGATIHAGALEGSNASDTSNMVNMIAVYRSYEANQKVVQTINTTYQQGSSIGQVTGL